MITDYKGMDRTCSHSRSAACVNGERMACRSRHDSSSLGGGARGQGPTKGCQFSLRALLLAVTVVAVGFAIVRVIVTRATSSSEIREHLRRNLRMIQYALHQYHVEQGQLPHSALGPENALYDLRGYVDASRFDDVPDKPECRRAYWDHESRCLCNSDFLYLNVSDAQEHRHRVVLCSVAHARVPRVCIGTVAGQTWTRCFWKEKPTAPGESYLGNWVTVEGFLIPDSALFRDWCQTHPFTSVESFGTSGVEYTTGVVIRHEFDRHARLCGCTIETGKGTIMESVDTDHLGRIVGIRRRPVDWASLLPE